MTEGDRDRLDQMIYWIDEILRLVPESEEEFIGDPTRFGIASLFINLGQCAKDLDEATKADLPAVPWRELAGLRDVLAHNTTSVEYGVVWRAVGDLPRVRQSIKDWLEAGSPS